jgi:DnaK suppressor protein
VVASPKKPAAKKAVKPLVKPKAVAKPVAKKAAPAKKPVSSAKPKAAAAKKAVPAKKPVAAKKAAPAKKPTPAPKAAVKKPAVKKAVVAAKPAVSKKAAPPPKAKPTRPSAHAKGAPAKAAAKAPLKPVAKPAAKPTPVPTKSPAVKAAPAASAKKVPVKKADTAPTPVVSPVAAPVASDQPVRSTRPSARLAQITVPSLPPAVASTAAKASYLPSMSQAVVTAPLFPVKKDAKLANNWKNKSVDQLSDAEILAMPDSEYMNDLQMAYFRRKLVALKQDILANAGETTEHLREDTVVVPDPADRATIEEEHALELRTRDRERKLLKKIEQSIIRIDAGDYGYCDETGEPIGVGRLLARPTATLSLEAQQRRELKQKMFGD